MVAVVFIETTRLVAGMELPGRLTFLRLVYVLALCSGASIAMYVVWVLVPRIRPLCAAIFIAVLVLNGAAVVSLMGGYWSDPNNQREDLYDGAAVGT